MFRPLNVPFSPSSTQATSLMAPGGMNKRDLQLLLGVENAVQVTNYLIRGEGELEKRGGLSSLTDQAGINGVSMIKEFTSDIIIFGFATTIAAYEISTGTYTALKTDFSTNTGFDGARYGDYFFVVNGIDSMYRFYREIAANFSYNASGTNTIYFNSQTSNFTVGQVLTGGTSGATATITAQTDSGTSGNLTVTPVNGTAFQLGETITDPLGGSAQVGTINTITTGSRVTGATSGATANVIEISGGGGSTQTLVLGRINGTFQSGEVLTGDQSTGIGRVLTTSAVTWSNSAVSDAPIGSVVSVIGNRLYVGNIKDDTSAVAYPEADTGANPPFSGWTDSSTSTDGGTVRYRSASTVNSITNLGPYVQVFSDEGRFTFFTDVLDSGGSIVKKDDFIDSRIDFGGDRGAITTEKGIFYANEAGIHQLISTGQTDVPFSEQSLEITNLLGDDYFTSIDFSDADMVYDQKQRYLFVTCARASETNNLVIGYSFDNKAIIEIQGWNIKRFLNINHQIYGSHTDKAEIFKLFDGFLDDGRKITTELYQEVRIGELYTRQSIEKFYIQGRFSETTNLNIDFDIYDAEGEFVQALKSYTMTTQILGNMGGGVGYDEIGYDGAYEDDPSTAEDGLINAFDGAAPGIKNAKRVLVRITSTDASPHKLNWMNVQGRIKAPIRRRQLTLNS